MPKNIPSDPILADDVPLARHRPSDRSSLRMGISLREWIAEAVLKQLESEEE